MVGPAIARGFRTAAREWRLALLLWVLGLVMALVVAGPVLAWWGGATARATEADRMLGGLDMGVLTELIVNQRGGWPLLFGLLVSTALLARVLQAFVLGGIVEVLRNSGAEGHTDTTELRASARRNAALVPATTGSVRTGENPASAGFEIAGAEGHTDTTELRASARRNAADLLVPRLSPTTVAAIDQEPRVAVADLEGAAAAVAVIEAPATPEPAPGAPTPAASTSTAPAPAPVASRSPVLPAPVAHVRERRSVVAQFFRGGGRFFLRNLVMLVLTGLGIVVGANILRWLGARLVKPLDSTTSELLAYVNGLLPLALGVLGALFFLLVFDYACIRLDTEDNRRPVRTWLSAVGFVARRFVAALALWIVPGLVVAAAALLYLRFRLALPAMTAATIAVMVVVQQLFLVVRAILRTATVDAEMAYADARGFVQR